MPTLSNVYPYLDINKASIAQAWVMKDCSFEECHYYNGQSYQAYTEDQLSLGDQVGDEMHIFMDFRTSATDGLMFYFGGNGVSTYFVSIYVDNYIVVTLDVGCGVQTISATLSVNDNSWHMLTVQKYGTWINARVDNHYVSHGMYDPLGVGCNSFSTNGKVYIGGVGDESKAFCNYDTAVSCNLDTWLNVMSLFVYICLDVVNNIFLNFLNL